ncbi:hypothetical protein OEB99_16750 [Actinotalea sp. M2MS4P-6]|uniref:hypothetical protein n=1 Tax=Actinotalea sp. M2MS4P-6 TaxID=2983762 RepID=UPI0021E4DF45|nr:hypothetical protein [Actinotalea sp. M2MS4P-6]MCV2395967.1 hypothetical protein [Actinotalea sp. M2MS4P-6]
MDDQRGWELLADFAAKRRRRLGLNQGDLKSRGGPGASTVGKIERAEGPFPLRTQHALENALGWSRGGVELLLRAPSEPWFEDQFEDLMLQFVENNIPDMSAPPASTTPVASARDLTDEELLAELTYRMRRYALSQGDDAESERETDDGDSTPTTAAGSAPAETEIDARRAAEVELLGQLADSVTLGELRQTAAAIAAPAGEGADGPQRKPTGHGVALPKAAWGLAARRGNITPDEQ